MKQKKLYIIAGPNGAGKTTASIELLPSLWDCKEFINADEIARGLSPLNPEEMTIQAARIQLKRITELLSSGLNFSIETTLATRIYKKLILEARKTGYEIELYFFWLPSPEDAIDRVRLRVENGGHNIPEDVVFRRYYGGLRNLFSLYIPLVDRWTIVDNCSTPSRFIAKYNVLNGLEIYNQELFNQLHMAYGNF